MEQVVPEGRARKVSLLAPGVGGEFEWKMFASRILQF